MPCRCSFLGTVLSVRRVPRPWIRRSCASVACYSRFVQRICGVLIMIHYTDSSWNIGDLLGWCRSNYLLTLSCGAVSQREVSHFFSRVDSWETPLSWCAKHLGKTCFFIQLDFWANNRHTTSHSPRIAESQHWSAGFCRNDGPFWISHEPPATFCTALHRRLSPTKKTTRDHITWCWLGHQLPWLGFYCPGRRS